jgi:hypothetical protein
VRVFLHNGQWMALVSVPAGEHRIRLHRAEPLYRWPVKVSHVSLPAKAAVGDRLELSAELEFPAPLRAEVPGTLALAVGGRVALVKAVTLQARSKGAKRAVLRLSLPIPEKVEPGNYEASLCLEGFGSEGSGRLGTISIAPR